MSTDVRLNHSSFKNRQMRIVFFVFFGGWGGWGGEENYILNMAQTEEEWQKVFLVTAAVYFVLKTKCLIITAK